MPLGVLTGYSEVGKALRKQELNRKGQLGGLGQQLQEGEPGIQGAEAGEGVWVPRILGARSLHFQATQPHQGLCERQFLFPKGGKQLRWQGENTLFILEEILFHRALHLEGNKAA